MRIVVEDEGFHLNLPIPTRLVANRVAAGVLCRVLEKQGVTVTRAQLMVFVKELHRFRRRHPKWTLVEVKGHDGEYVKIQL